MPRFGKTSSIAPDFYSVITSQHPGSDPGVGVLQYFLRSVVFFFIALSASTSLSRHLYKDELLQPRRSACGCPSTTIRSCRVSSSGIPTSRISSSAAGVPTAGISPAVPSAAISTGSARQPRPIVLRSFSCSFVLLLCAGRMLLSMSALEFGGVTQVAII